MVLYNKSAHKFIIDETMATITSTKTPDLNSPTSAPPAPITPTTKTFVQSSDNTQYRLVSPVDATVLPTYTSEDRAHSADLFVLAHEIETEYNDAAQRLSQIRPEVWRAVVDIGALEVTPITKGGTIFDKFEICHGDVGDDVNVVDYRDHASSVSSYGEETIVVFQMLPIHFITDNDGRLTQLLNAMDEAITLGLPRAVFEVNADTADFEIGVARTRVAAMSEFAGKLEALQWECGIKGLLVGWYRNPEALGIEEDNIGLFTNVQREVVDAEWRKNLASYYFGGVAANSSDNWSYDDDEASEDGEVLQRLRGLKRKLSIPNPNRDEEEISDDEEEERYQKKMRMDTWLSNLQDPTRQAPRLVKPAGAGFLVLDLGHAGASKPVLTLAIPPGRQNEVVDLGYVDVSKPAPKPKLRVMIPAGSQNEVVDLGYVDVSKPMPKPTLKVTIPAGSKNPVVELSFTGAPGNFVSSTSAIPEAGYSAHNDLTAGSATMDLDSASSNYSAIVPTTTPLKGVPQEVFDISPASLHSIASGPYAADDSSPRVFGRFINAEPITMENSPADELPVPRQLTVPEPVKEAILPALRSRSNAIGYLKRMAGELASRLGLATQTHGETEAPALRMTSGGQAVLHTESAELPTPAWMVDDDWTFSWEIKTTKDRKRKMSDVVGAPSVKLEEVSPLTKGGVAKEMPVAEARKQRKMCGLIKSESLWRRSGVSGRLVRVG